MKFIKVKSQEQKKIAREFRSKLLAYLTGMGDNYKNPKMTHDKFTYLIQVNGAYVGCFCLVNPITHGDNPKLWRPFYRFWIEPKYRGKGYGTKTLLKIMKSMLSTGETLYLSCFKANLKAQKLYETLGFERIDTEEDNKEIFYTKEK
ncbi:MAG: GNAT family N-acetyltransferase [Cetobacterium sp.]